MNRYGRFILNDLDSRDYGIIMTKAPPLVLAERETETVSVAGASGDLHIDMGRYKNVTIPYQCAILPVKGSTLRETVEAATPLLRPTAGYHRLEDSFTPNLYRVARIGTAVSVESIVERAGSFTIEFDCKPQRFYKSGEFAVTLTGAGGLYNQTEFPAKPIITVYGSGAGTLTVGEVTVEIKTLADYITLDCEIQDAYRKGVSTQNMNGCIAADVFPTLEPGSNTIKWTGGITKIEIIPRWWTL